MLVMGKISILLTSEVFVIYFDFFDPIIAGNVWMKYSSPKADCSLANKYSESIVLRETGI
jgi:hypothetical protein